MYVGIYASSVSLVIKELVIRKLRNPVSRNIGKQGPQTWVEGGVTLRRSAQGAQTTRYFGNIPQMIRDPYVISGIFLN